MHVEMKDRLSCNFPVVREDVESLKIQRRDNSPGNDLCYVQNVVQIRLLDVKKVRTMRLGNYKCVTIVNGIDIENCNYVFILIENFGWQLVPGNSTENTIHYCRSVIDEIQTLL